MNRILVDEKDTNWDSIKFEQRDIRKKKRRKIIPKVKLELKSTKLCFD